MMPNQGQKRIRASVRLMASLTFATYYSMPSGGKINVVVNDAPRRASTLVKLLKRKAAMSSVRAYRMHNRDHCPLTT